MRKLLSVLLAMLLFGTIAIAEIPDVNDLSTEQLLELYSRIMSELSDRSDIPSFTAPISNYEAGKDFPIGKYIISSPGYCTYVTIYDNSADYESNKPSTRETTLYGDKAQTMVVDFTSGMIVEIGFAPARFEPFTGLVFE